MPSKVVSSGNVGVRAGGGPTAWRGRRKRERSPRLWYHSLLKRPTNGSGRESTSQDREVLHHKVLRCTRELFEGLSKNPVVVRLAIAALGTEI